MFQSTTKGSQQASTQKYEKGKRPNPDYSKTGLPPTNLPMPGEHPIQRFVKDDEGKPAQKKEEKELQAKSEEKEHIQRKVKPNANQNKTGIANSTVKGLSNGDVQLTQSMPFTQTISSSEPSAPEKEGESIFIPEVIGTEDLSSNLDDISANLNYSPTVTQTGTVGSGAFGVTRSGSTLANAAASYSAASGSGVYTITGDLVLTITWQVHSGTGPGGQVNISSENDSAITAANFASVASDLTPNSSGRPPRSNFWAQDITERHERYHAVNQRQLSFGPKRVTAIQNWLNSKTVTAASEVNATLIQQALNEGTRAFNLLVALPSTEGDAYTDGKTSYQTRAAAITTKGVAGNY